MENILPIEELLYEEESTTLDFKREEYKFQGASDLEKSELLKDILAFSNAWRRTDAYILIGVEEVKGERSKVLGIKEELDDAHLQQFVNSKTQRPVVFDYRTVVVDSMKIGVVRIPVQARPLFVEKDFGKLKRHVVYIRRGSSTAEANPDEVRDMGRTEFQETEEIPALNFEFAELGNRSSLGTDLSINATLLNLPPIKEIPDYREERNIGSFGMFHADMNRPNSDYYRELAKFYFVSNRSSELAFLLRNESNKAISDIRVELVIEKSGNRFTFFKASKFPDVPSSHYDLMGSALRVRPLAEQIAEKNRKSIEIQDLGNRFRIEVPFEKVQPKQTVFATKTIYLSANDSFNVEAKVTIYADNIPIPIEQLLKITCDATSCNSNLNHIKELHKKYLQSKLAV